MRIVLFLIFAISVLFAEIAKVSTVVGDAKILRGSNTLKIDNGTQIEKDDIVITSKNSKLQIIFNDNTVITVGKNSKLDINDYIFDEVTPTNSKTDFNLLKGTFKVITGKIGKINRDKFKLKVKSSTIGIRGTNFIVRLEQKGFQVTVTDGGVYVTHPKAPDQKVLVNKNQTAKIIDGKIEVYEVTVEEKKSEELALEPEEDSDSEDTDENSSSGSTSSENSFEDSSVDESSDDDSTSSNTTTTSDSTTNDETSTTQVASEAATDSSSDESIVKTYTLNGELLGSYYDGSTASLRSFIRTDDGVSDNLFTATRVEEKFSFNDKILKKYEQTSSANQTVTHIGSNTYSGTYGSGSYTGNMSVGTIPLTYYYENTGGEAVSVTTNYSVQADNLGEFFIAYANDTDYKELFVVGTDSSTSSFDTSKIYSYDVFADMKVTKDSSSNITSIDIKTDDKAIEYYNPLYNSMTHLNSDFYDKGAQEFVFGNNSSVKTYRNKYTYTYSTSGASSIAVATTGTNLTKIDTATTNADISFKGSQVQGLLYDLTTTNTATNFSGSTTTDVTTTTQTLGGSFLDTNDSVNVDNSTETLNYSGFLVGEIHGEDNQRESSSNLSLKIEKNSSDKTVAISGSGSIFDSTNNGVDLALEGNLSANNAYFINDDLFGVMTKKGDSVYKIGSNDYNLVDNSGYLIAVPDGGFDSNDNPIMLDDESSWGYWTGKFDDGAGNNITFVDTSSTWVAGVETASSIVDSTMLNVSGIYEYKGHVLGDVLTSTGNLENIIYGKYNGTSYTNEVNIKFNIGSVAKTISGTMGFSSTNGTTTPTQWDVSLTGNTITNTKFDGSISGGGSSGSFEGKYFGTSSVKSVGGTFNVTNANNDQALGVFKAVKQ